MTVLSKLVFSASSLYYLQDTLFLRTQNQFFTAADDLEDDDEDELTKEPQDSNSAYKPPHWSDTVYTTDLWKLVARDGQSDEKIGNADLESFLYRNPTAATARSTDGRGGMWWAWEYKNAHAMACLKAYDADVLVESNEAMKDSKGQYPLQMCLPAVSSSSGGMFAGLSEECKALVKDIDGKVEAILKRKKEMEWEDENDNIDDDDIEDEQDEKVKAEMKKKADFKKAKTKTSTTTGAPETDDDDDDDDDDDLPKKPTMPQASAIDEDDL